jgi:rhodanese-related sulfurtransferase
MRTTASPVRNFKQVFSGLTVALLIAGCAPPTAPAIIEKPVAKPNKIPSTYVSKGKSTGIGLEEFFGLQQSGNVLIYDVRVPYFYGIDHIPGAVNWPHTDFDAQIVTRNEEITQALKSGKRVVFYCFNLGCAEARSVARKVARRDHNVSVLGTGIDGWREAGLPVE